MRLKNRNDKDQDQPSKPERGDIYILIGVLVGIIIVGVAGPICGIHYFGFSGAYLSFFGGVIVGGIIGATVGYLIKKRRGKTKTNAQKPF